MPEAISDSSTLLHLACIESVGRGMMAKIPRFGTEQEMQEFWDTHDSAEYFEDMKDDGAEVEFNRDKGVLVIPMVEDRVRSLRGIALEEGVSSNVSEKLDR